MSTQTAETKATKPGWRREAKEWTIAFGISLFMVSMPAMAQVDELGDGVCKLVGYLTGKWLFGIAVLSGVAAGGALLFGAELTDGVKKFATIVSIVAVILGFSSILAFAFSKFSSYGSSCS